MIKASIIAGPDIPMISEMTESSSMPDMQKGIIKRKERRAIRRVREKILTWYGATPDLILGCEDDRKPGCRKPTPGLLLEGMRHVGARPTDTPFVFGLPQAAAGSVAG